MFYIPRQSAFHSAVTILCLHASPPFSLSLSSFPFSLCPASRTWEIDSFMVFQLQHFQWGYTQQVLEKNIVEVNCSINYLPHGGICRFCDIKLYDAHKTSCDSLCLAYILNQLYWNLLGGGRAETGWVSCVCHSRVPPPVFCDVCQTVQSS